MNTANGFDALIVGGGPAGLSGALILGRCRRSILVCDTGAQRNLASDAVHALLGQEGRPPVELLASGRAELSKYPTIQYRAASVTSVEAEDGGFTFECSDGSRGTARKVLLATGLVDDIPRLKGIESLYGRSVHHCLYCDGFEHRDRPLAAYGKDDKAVGLALMMKNWSPDVVLCTDGTEVSSDAANKLHAQQISILTEPVSSLEGREGNLRRIHFAGGSSIERDAMFFVTGCHQQSDLSKTLGVARDAKGGVITDAQSEETSMPGVYVAGDVSRDVLLVAVAIAEGAKAAVAINRALLREDGLC